MAAENQNQAAQDPFASEREAGNDPFAGDLEKVSGSDDMSPSSDSPSGARRMSDNWDASKVPPSQFQKRKGSIYATPNSRDSHIKGSTRDKAYHEKLKEKGWN